MSKTSIPDAVLSFIRASVTSVWALDLLLFLRAHPAESWTVEQLVRELRGSGPMIADLLITLRRARLIETVGERHRFQPADDTLRAVVDELERVSSATPLAVRNAILAAPHDKVQVFADAFRIKRD